MNNILQSRRPQPWRQCMKKGCWMRALDRLSPLPPSIKQASEWRFRCGTSLKMELPPHRPMIKQRLTTVLPRSPQQIRDLAREGWTEGAEEPAEEETAEEESYVPATGQGCFSFEMSLLQRAAQTFAKRTVADHYLQVARWLHTGLAMTISRQSWHLLSKHRTNTRLVKSTFQVWIPLHGPLDKKKPCAATDDWSQSVPDWEWQVNQVLSEGYMASTCGFRRQREAGPEHDFFRLIVQLYCPAQKRRLNYRCTRQATSFRV